MPGAQFEGLLQIVTDLKGSVAKLEKLGGKLDQTKTKAKGAGQGVGTLEQGLFKLQAAIAILGFKRLIDGFIDSGLAMERMERALLAVLGSTQAANSEIGFLIGTARRLGVPLKQAGEEYAKLAAAAKATGIEMSVVQDTFTTMSEASVVLGLRQDQLKGIFIALNQMISKGKVQTEELRRQLGDRLPGAFALAAKAMNVTTGELDRMLEAGEIMTADFLPKFNKEVSELFSKGLTAAIESPQAAIGRLQTSLFLFQDKAFAGFRQVLVDGANDIGKALDGMGDQARFLGESVGFLGNRFADLVRLSDATFDVLQPLWETSAEGHIKIQNMAAVFMDLGSAVGDFITDSDPLSVRLQTLIGEFSDLDNEVNRLHGTIEDIGGAADTSAGAFLNLIQEIDAVKESSAAAGAEGLNAMAQALISSTQDAIVWGKMNKEMAADVGTAIVALRERYEELGEEVPAVLDFLNEKLREFDEAQNLAISQEASDNLNTLISGFKELGIAGPQMAQQVIEALSGIGDVTDVVGIENAELREELEALIEEYRNLSEAAGPEGASGFLGELITQLEAYIETADVAEDSTEGLNEEFDALAEATEKAAKAMFGNKEELERNTQAVVDAIESQKQLNKGQEFTAKQAENMKKKLKELLDQWEALGEDPPGAVKALAKEFGVLSSTQEDAAKEAAKLAKEQEKLAKKIGKTTDETEELTEALKALKDAEEAASDALDRTNDVLEDRDDLEQRIQELRDKPVLSPEEVNELAAAEQKLSDMRDKVREATEGQAQAERDVASAAKDVEAERAKERRAAPGDKKAREETIEGLEELTEATSKYHDAIKLAHEELAGLISTGAQGFPILIRLCEELEECLSRVGA